MPDTFAIHKEEMIIKYTDAKCLAIEESLDGGTIDGISGDVTSQYDEAYCTRKGLLHGLWMPCNTLVCEDKDLLEYTLHKTCGNFRFKHSKKPCFGLNAYIGKKNAKYVRPSPRISKCSTTHSEYYRSSFDSTFHPLIYKMLNQLSSQVLDFQTSADPVYDRFLYESFVNDKCLTTCSEPKKEDDCSKSCNKRKREQSKVDYGDHRKKHLSQRRFAALSILTCGNDILRGFANIGHKDNDFLYKQFHHCSLHILNAMEVKQTGNMHLKWVLCHTRRIQFNTKFSTITTCAYNIFSKLIRTKRVHAYFMCKSLGIAVSIPTKTSCYHTFDGTMGTHQTTAHTSHILSKR